MSELDTYSKIYSVGASLASYLNRVYPEKLRTDYGCTFILANSSNFTSETELDATASLFLYRVAQEQTRGSNALSLVLHYLLTVWQSRASAEQVVLAWTMSQMQARPLLDPSVLEGPGWAVGESVQWTFEQLTTDEIMRVWDHIRHPYHLSVGYSARVVRIDVPEVEGKRVVATRFGFDEKKREDE